MHTGLCYIKPANSVFKGGQRFTVAQMFTSMEKGSEYASFRAGHRKILHLIKVSVFLQAYSRHELPEETATPTYVCLPLTL